MLVRLQGGNSNGRLTSFGKAATITIRRRGKCSERGKKVLRLEEHSETPQRESAEKAIGLTPSLNYSRKVCFHVGDCVRPREFMTSPRCRLHPASPGSDRSDGTERTQEDIFPNITFAADSPTNLAGPQQVGEKVAGVPTTSARRGPNDRISNFR